MEQVDTFLDAVRATLGGYGNPPLTAEEIRTKKFATTRLRPGYDEEEVDAFLDEAEAKLRIRSAERGVKAAQVPPDAAPGQAGLAAEPGDAGSGPEATVSDTGAPAWAAGVPPHHVR